MKKYFKRYLLELFRVSKINLSLKYDIEKLDSDYKKFYYDNYPVDDFLRIVDNLSDSKIMDLMVIIKNDVSEMYNELFRELLSNRIVNYNERIQIIKIYKLYLLHKEIFIPIDDDDSAGFEDLIDNILNKKLRERIIKNKINDNKKLELVDFKFGLDKIEKMVKKYNLTINKSNAKYIFDELLDTQYYINWKYNKFDIVDLNSKINKILVKRFN